MKPNYLGGQFNRRTRSLARLENQLVTGKKNGKELHAKEPNGFHFVDTTFDLEEGDIKRIKKEIATLKSRI